MAGKKKITKDKEVVSEVKQNRPLTFSDYFNFTESYTSLILGIVVVIIASILMISFFKNRNIGKFPNRQEISATSTVNKAALSSATPSAVLSGEISEKPQSTPTEIPTVTKAVQATPTPAPSKVIEKQIKKLPNSYTVAKGDTLWSIAEKAYNDGYRWVDIAKANNLTNPNSIDTGLQLKLSQVSPTPTTAQAVQIQPNAPGKIVGTKYTVVHGDYLWAIALRAYGDGYRWVDIARANNLANPGLIHADNVLKIPR